MSALQANCLCWCGFEHGNNQGHHAYRCLPFGDMKVWPELHALFLIRLQRAHMGE